MTMLFVSNNELYARTAAERESENGRIAMVFERFGMFEVRDDGPREQGWRRVFTAFNGKSILDGDLS